MYYCPQCGEITPDLHEGYCLTCCTENQQNLDAHNDRMDQWASMNDRQKDDAIARAVWPA